jgi:hypothetical protein
MANNINISSVISPDILKTVSSSTAIKTFGEQLKDQAKEKVISVALGKANQIKDQIQEIVLLKVKVWSDYNTELKRLDILLKEKQISQEKYDEAVIIEGKSRDQKLKDLDKLEAKLREDLSNIIKDPFKKIKDNLNRRKVKKARRKARNKAERAKARRDLAKKVAKNAAKTLAPIIALQLSNRFASILSQRSKLETLVDQINVYIDQAETPDQIAIATNLRNNTIALINNSIGKLTSLQQTINQINLYITIFNAIITILSAIPIPTAVPPGIGIPVNLIVRIVKTLERAQKLVSALNVILSVVTISLENEIIKLEELILRLKDISQNLTDKSLTNLNQQQLTALTNFFSPVGVNDFPPYKGFKFVIKTEENKTFEVKGNKRRYAVAVDRDGVDVLKSELSFTLDPQDLVDQLKLIIDQRNLQG